MATNPRLTNAAASACAGDGSNAGIRGYIGSGSKLAFFVGAQNTWSGASEPAPAGTLLATLTAASSFGAASSGVITASGSPPYTSNTAVASGTAGSFVLYKSDGTTIVMDGTVGTSGCDINFDNNVFVSGGTVAISAFSITVPPH